MKKGFFSSLILASSLFATLGANAESFDTTKFEQKYPSLTQLEVANSQYLRMLWASSNKQLSKDPSLPHDTDFQYKSECIMKIPNSEIMNFRVEKIAQFTSDDLVHLEKFAQSNAGKHLANFYTINSSKVLNLKPYESVEPTDLVNSLSDKDKQTIQNFYKTPAGMNYMSLLNRDFAKKMLDTSRHYCP